MSIPDGAPLCIREVWSFNLHSEFELIRSVLSFYPYVSIDTEFPGVVLKPNSSSPTPLTPNQSAKVDNQVYASRVNNYRTIPSVSTTKSSSTKGDGQGYYHRDPGANRPEKMKSEGKGSNCHKDWHTKADGDCAGAKSKLGRGYSDATYRTMKVNVDRMKLIQVGLTFMDEDGVLPMLSDGTYCAWQFNFRGFDPDADIYQPSSIALLKSCGIDFNKNQLFGVDCSLFRELLLSCGLLFNNNVHYICFHGAYDFAYLLKLITCECLPPDEEAFLRLLKHYFGTFYDLKYMQIHLNMHGGLEKLARALGIKRIGASHQAGSDSLLTSSSFQRMKDLYFLDHCKDYSGVLFGLALPKAKAIF